MSDLEVCATSCNLMQTQDQPLVVTVSGEVLPQRQLQLTAGAAEKVGGDVDVDRFFIYTVILRSRAHSLRSRVILLD